MFVGYVYVWGMCVYMYVKCECVSDVCIYSVCVYDVCVCSICSVCVLYAPT